MGTIVSTNSLVMEMPDFFNTDCVAGDILCRYTPEEDEHKTFTMRYADTQTVMDGINNYIFQHSQNIELLRSVIFWQKRTIDYQALYTAFLLESISEEDFETESDKFMIHYNRVEPEHIAHDIDKMDSLIGIDFDTSDYSDFFQCDQENVMEGLKLLPSENFKVMLPDSVKGKED